MQPQTHYTVKLISIAMDFQLTTLGHHNNMMLVLDNAMSNKGIGMIFIPTLLTPG